MKISTTIDKKWKTTKPSWYGIKYQPIVRRK